MEIYITRANEQFGPYSDEDVRRHLASGELSVPMISRGGRWLRTLMSRVKSVFRIPG
jgi:hypothetical protein